MSGVSNIRVSEVELCSCCSSKVMEASLRSELRLLRQECEWQHDERRMAWMEKRLAELEEWERLQRSAA